MYYNIIRLQYYKIISNKYLTNHLTNNIILIKSFNFDFNLQSIF